MPITRTAVRRLSRAIGRVMVERSFGIGTPPTPAIPANLSAPVITGSLPVGSVLACAVGAWSGYPPPAYTFQWRRAGVDISGATSSTYTTVSGDIGQATTCRVTATNSQGSASATSNSLTPTAALVAPANTVAPSTSGSTVAGGTRTSGDGTWTGNPTPTLSRNWQVNSGSWADIPGETGSSLTIPAAGDYRLRVRGTNSQGTLDAYSSSFTATAALAAPVNTVAPTTSGSATVGGTRTATTGTWTGNPTPTYAYQWQKNISTVWTNISGQTASTYTLTEEGDFRCVVTATNSQGSASANTSSFTVTAAAAGAFDPYYDPAFELVSSTTLLTRPTESKPASKATGYGTASYTDQRFGTRIYRATDVADSPDASQTYLRHEYSRKQAFNCDGTKFIAQSTNGYWYLYDAQTFAKIAGGRTISPGNTALGSGSSNQFAGDCEPTWHPTDPNKLWRTEQNGSLTWYEFDIVSKATTTLFSLSGKLAAFGLSSATRAWWQGEGRPSNDGRWWGLSLQDAGFNQIGLCMYDRQTDTVVGAVATTNKPNNVSTSPLGNYVIPSWSNGSGLSMSAAAAAAIGSTDGTRAYSRDFSTFTQLSYYGEHADTGVDAAGNEVYISVNYNAGNMPDVTDGAIYYRRMDNGVAYTLPINMYGGAQASAMHVSGCAFDRPGWAVVGTYGSGAAQTGAVYSDDVIMLVEMVPSSARVYRLAHHQTRYSDYWDEPHSTPSRDLTKVLFASDFGGTNRESYMIGLPSWVLPAAPTNTLPANTVAPTTSGSTNVGGTRTSTDGTWTGYPTPTITRNWQKFVGGVWTDQGITTSSTSALDAGDWRLRVRGSNVVGDVDAYSSSFTVTNTLTAPTNSAVPTTAGSVYVGGTRNGTAGAWSGNPTPTLAYQWQRDISSVWTDVAGATSLTGFTIPVIGDYRLRERATNSQGTADAYSTTFTALAAPAAPTVGASTKVSGTNADANTTPSMTTQSGSRMLVIAMGIAGGGTPTCTDSKGNTYTLIESSLDLGSNAYYNDLHVFEATGITGGSGHTVTVARAGAYNSIVAVEVRGATTRTSGLGTRATGSPYTSNSQTPSAAALLLAVMGAETSFNATPSYAWSNGFTTVQGEASSTDWALAIAQKTAANGDGAQTTACTLTGPTALDGIAGLVIYQ